MIVTIDGPAGAGKSSVARSLAERLGFQFLDTGAMYRAVAWAGIRDGIALDDERALIETAKRIEIRFSDHQVLVDGVDVSADIRTPEVTAAVKYAAGNPGVRQLMVQQQQDVGAAAQDLVTEGRDQGSIVFPQAECKIFLTASAEERARRRYRELTQKGEVTTYAEVLGQQNARDASDQSRTTGPMVKPDDAIEVYTDEMTEEQVVNHLAWIVDSTRVSHDE